MPTRSLLIALCLVLPSVAANAAKLPTIFDGYVTNVASQDQFEIGARRVTTNSKTTRTLMQAISGADTSVGPTIRVGSWLHVEGGFDKRTGEFIAQSISFLPQPGRESKPNERMEEIGLTEEKPELRVAGKGAAGTLWVNGYPLKVTPQTKLLSDDGKNIPVDQIHTNMWASFQSKWLPDHSMEALSIRFSPNVISRDEAKFRDSSEPEVQLPDYANGKAGKINFHYHWSPNIPWSLKVLPNRAIQEYVAKVGESLIPEYQKELPASDPAKINFRFYVIEKPSRWKEVLNDAQVTAGGVIVIPDNVLAVLDNEAQLAALLSNCIAITLGKQFYVHRGRAKTQNAISWASDFAGLYGLPVGIGNSIAANRLLLHINEQASRIGLRYMLNAGYDIREAPFAWTAAANGKVENPEAPGNLPSALVQSVMADLYFDYPAIDYSKLKTNRSAYRAMLANLRSTAPKLPKSKNYPGE